MATSFTLGLELLQGIHHSLGNRQELLLLESPPDNLYADRGAVVGTGFICATSQGLALPCARSY
jgi:hypothetical protein